jgi:hypothetical protein
MVLSHLIAFSKNIAAQQDHRDACFALTAWYLVGSPGVLPQSDTEAYLWAKRAAEGGLAKAMYAVGYFLEVGIGCQQDTAECVRCILSSKPVIETNYQVFELLQAGCGSWRQESSSAAQNFTNRKSSPTSR